MSTDNDVARSLGSWLKENRHEDANRVLDAVFDQVPATPQRRAGWLARRFPPMSNTLRYGIATVVVAVAAIIGFNYINKQVGTDEPTPSSSPTEDQSTSSPTPESVRPLPSDGPVSGRYAIEVPDSTVNAELTVSGGWSAGGYYVMSDAGSVSFWTVANVPSDACDFGGTLPDPPIGSTVDALVSALDAQLSTDMTPAEDVSIGGYAGKRVELRPISSLPESCTHLRWWVTADEDPGGRGIEGAPGAGFDAVWILDVEEQRVVIVGFWTQSGMAHVMEVIDSISFTRR